MLNLLHNFSHVGVYSCRVCLSESFFVSAVDLIRFDDICSFVYHLGLREYTVGFLNFGPVLDCQTWVHTVGSLQIFMVTEEDDAGLQSDLCSYQ